MPGPDAQVGRASVHLSAQEKAKATDPFATLLLYMTLALECPVSTGHWASLTYILLGGPGWAMGPRKQNPESSLAFGIRHLIGKYFLPFCSCLSTFLILSLKHRSFHYREVQFSFFSPLVAVVLVSSSTIMKICASVFLLRVLCSVSSYI